MVFVRKRVVFSLYNESGMVAVMGFPDARHLKHLSKCCHVKEVSNQGNLKPKYVARLLFSLWIHPKRLLSKKDTPLSGQH